MSPMALGWVKIGFPRRLIDDSRRSLFPSVFVIYDNDDRQQRKNQHVIFSLRQNESVHGEGDETAGQRPGDCAGFRHVGDKISQAMPDRKQHQPDEKYKSRDSGLKQNREDVAVDRTVDNVTPGRETVPGDRVRPNKRNPRNPLLVAALVAGRSIAAPKNNIMRSPPEQNQPNHKRE